MFKGPAYYLEEGRLALYKASSGVKELFAKVGLRAATGTSAASFGQAVGTSMQQGNGLIAATTGLMGSAVLTGFGFLGGLGISLLFERFANRKEQQIRQRQLLEMYRPQIAAACGVAPKEANMNHLAAVSETVPFFGKVLNDMNEKRISKNRVALLANVTSFGAVLACAIFALPALGIAGLGAMITLGVMGVGAYYASKGVYNKISDKLSDRPELDLESRMRSIQKLREYNRPLSHDLVMSVMAEANPELDARIKEEFGRPYFKLNEKQRVQVIHQFGEQYNLSMVHHGLNTDQIPVYELPFVANGTLSGAKIDGLWDSVKARMDEGRERVVQARHAVAERFSRNKGEEEEVHSPQIPEGERPDMGRWTQQRNAELQRTQPYFAR